MPSTPHSSSLLGDPSQIKQQLEITEPLIHAAGAELARGCRALLAALRSCRLPPPIEPSLLSRFDPTRRPQPRRGHPHPFIHPSHPSHLAAPTASRSTHRTLPEPPSPGAPRCRCPLRLTSAGMARTAPGRGAEPRCLPLRARAAPARAEPLSGGGAGLQPAPGVGVGVLWGCVGAVPPSIPGTARTALPPRPRSPKMRPPAALGSAPDHGIIKS